jgi:mono/diheme cytochrome c family protein
MARPRWQGAAQYLGVRQMTAIGRAPFLLALSLLLAVTGAAQAQQPSPDKGREILTTKCFQCHTNAMWQDQRQDTRAWEATLYRMVGRGALWTSDEIKAMAAYLGTDFGSNAKPSTPSK